MRKKKVKMKFKKDEIDISALDQIPSISKYQI